ncbi:CRISPR-associated endoribonuclease Cas6 [Streptomyces sp. NPDC005970]|uniref:CRISPR-associated endoribonuclease Cas6 n=1 Tax=Streptomyces sp. NPDC005970 TaxID=3156723 RepID=UPI0033FA71C7
MRVKVDVDVDAPSLRWEDVHGPARGVAYELIGSQDAALGRVLHDEGWGGSPLKPVGLTSPQFKGAPRKAGVYTTSRDGAIWFGSPVPRIASVLIAALAARQELQWGEATLRIRGINIDVPPPVAGGEVELVTATPVVIKHESRYLLPEDRLFLDRLQHNLDRKADLLELPAPQDLQVMDSGPRRRFTVRGAPRIGAVVRLRMTADARFVEAIRSWGLGLDTVQGFGWIR